MSDLTGNSPEQPAAAASGGVSEIFSSNQASDTAIGPAPSFSRTAWLVALSVVLNTMASIFFGEKISYLYKTVLHLSAGQVGTLGLIVGIPAYLRPFMGAASDLFPLFGFHRRSYYALSWLLYAAGWLAMACLHEYHVAAVVTLVIIGALGVNLLFVIMDSVMVAIGNQTGTVGRLQSIQQGIPLLMGLTFASQLRGYVTQHWSYTACFAVAAAFAASGIFLTPLVQERQERGQEVTLDIAERREQRLRERQQVQATLAQAARSPGLWAVVGYVFYLIITPGVNTAQFYFMNDALHFSPQFIGNLGVPGSAGAVIGLLLYGFASRRLPVRAIVWSAYLMDCSLYLASMGLRDHTSAIAVSFITAALGTIYTLSLLTIAARACPPGIEGTVYGLVMSAQYLAGALGEKIGATMYDFFGPASHHSTVHGWYGLLWAGFAFTVVAVVFIPFLPAWTKSREPLHAGSVV